MSAIVDDLRRMTAVGKDQYEIAGRTYWTDEDLQGVLNQRISARLLQARVEEIPTVNESGALVVLDGLVAVSGTLDAEGAHVFDSAGAAVDGATAQPDGRLEFETDQTTRSLLVTGIAYDLNGAAADVLTDWAAAVKGGYDVSIDGQALKRSQRHAQLLAQAEAFRSKAVIGIVRLTRSDTRRRR